MAAKFKWHGKRFQKRLKKHLIHNLRKAAMLTQTNARKNVNRNFNRVTGALLKSIAWEIDEAKLVARVGTNIKYGRIHELGGVITPKRARALAIPISDEAKKSRGPRFMDDLTYIPMKGRNPILVRIDENDEIGEVHWVLVESTTLPPRPYLRPAIDNHRARIAKILSTPLPETGAA